MNMEGRRVSGPFLSCRRKRQRFSYPVEIPVRRAGWDPFSAGQIAGLGAEAPYGNLNRPAIWGQCFPGRSQGIGDGFPLFFEIRSAF